MRIKENLLSIASQCLKSPLEIKSCLLPVLVKEKEKRPLVPWTQGLWLKDLSLDKEPMTVSLQTPLLEGGRSGWALRRMHGNPTSWARGMRHSCPINATLVIKRMLWRLNLDLAGLENAIVFELYVYLQEDSLIFQALYNFFPSDSPFCIFKGFFLVLRMFLMYGFWFLWI